MKKHRFLPWLILFGCLVIPAALWWPRPVPRPAQAMQWRKATQAERMAAIRSIRNQLKAFRSDDYKTAVKYQSSELQRNFPSLAAFRNTMRRSYPQFTNYRSATFGTAQASPKGKYIVIPIELTGRDKVKVRAVYLMVLENRVFRVDGVMGGEHLPQLPSLPNRPGREKLPGQTPATVDL